MVGAQHSAPAEQVYEALGRKVQSRADLERIFAQDPTFDGLELFQPMV